MREKALMAEWNTRGTRGESTGMRFEAVVGDTGTEDTVYGLYIPLNQSASLK